MNPAMNVATSGVPLLDALARGWLLAWIVWSLVPVGSLVLGMVHVVTGGRWGATLAPILRPATALVPLAAVAFLGIAVALPVLYPWAADPGSVKPGVARFYLNPLAFDLRAGIALVGWSVLAVLLLSGRGTRLVAGLGLAFFGLTISLVAVDWILSVEPHFVSSAFAADIAIHQMLAALAWIAVTRPPALDGKAASDLAKLILATLLGVLYLGLMAYIVAWYGDLPPKALWYLKRGTAAWGAVLVTALVLGGVLPFGMLLLSAVRRSPGALRVVGLFVLIGVALHLAWTLLPAYGDGAGAAAASSVLGFVVLGLLSRPAARWVLRRAEPAADGELRHA